MYSSLHLYRARYKCRDLFIISFYLYGLTITFFTWQTNKVQTIKDKKEMLIVDYEDASGQTGFEKPALLYLPAGSKELKVW